MTMQTFIQIDLSLKVADVATFCALYAALFYLFVHCTSAYWPHLYRERFAVPRLLNYTKFSEVDLSVLIINCYLNYNFYRTVWVRFLLMFQTDMTIELLGPLWGFANLSSCICRQDWHAPSWCFSTHITLHPTERTVSYRSVWDLK